MKHIYILALTLLLSSIATAQQNYVGNHDHSDYDQNTNYFQDHYLLGIKVTLENRGELVSLNLIGKNTGSQVQMAIYTDLDGVPNDLVAFSEKGEVTVWDKSISLAVEPTILEAGDYWLMAVYNEEGTHTYIDTDEAGNIIYYQDLVYGDDAPENALDFKHYEGRTFSYFMEVDEIKEEVAVANIVESTEPEIGLYPNPAVDKIYVTNMIEKKNILEVCDLSGKIVKTIESYSTTTDIDISDFTRGTYFVRINGTVTKKFVKS